MPADFPEAPATRRERVFAAVAIAWIATIGALVWWHARGAVQPPIYDAFTYYAKAKAVWDSVRGGLGGDLLALEPTFRPPGTVLMSYPFGFDADFRSFYFRSVFWPIVLVFVSVLVVAWRRATPARVRSMAVLTATFLTTASLFYYFEPYHDGPTVESHWGLVDGFLTGLAALATACAVRSVRSRSVAWATASAVVGVLMIFVKPTGVLIAAMTGSIVGLGWLHEAYRSWRAAGSRRVVPRFVVVIVVQAILLGGAVLVATQSRYLGPSNMMYGNAAIDVMRVELRIGWSELLDHLRGAIGPFLPIWAVASTAWWVTDRAARRSSTAADPLDTVLMLCAGAALATGLWFWLYGSGGGTQVRYFVPFAFVAIVCALDPLLTGLARAPRALGRALSAIMIVAIVNTTLLLAVPRPSRAWQRIAGVSVKSGTRPPGIEQARALIAKTPANVDAVVVYSTTSGISDAIITAVFDLQASKSDKPRFSVTRPIDWQRPSAFRIDEIVAADYILVDPTETPTAPPPSSITDFGLERLAFQDWAGHLTRDDGVETESAAPTSTLLRIVDRKKLRASLARLVRAHRWRDVFLANNEPKWWSEADVRAALADAPASHLEDVHFEDKFTVPALIVEPRRDGAVELRLWFRPSDAVRESDWVVFVHMIDAAGVTTADRSFVLAGLGKDPAPPDTPFSYLHARFVPPGGTVRIAVGFYRGTVILAADKGDRDWGGKRILFPVTAASR